jgi:hypothetical protein
VWRAPTRPLRGNPSEQAETKLISGGGPPALRRARAQRRGAVIGVRSARPVGDTTRNIAAQSGEPGSVLALCRDLIALRRAEYRGHIASYQQLPALGDAWTFDARRLRVTANFSSRPVDTGHDRGAGLGVVRPPALQGTTLAPWSRGDHQADDSREEGVAMSEMPHLEQAQDPACGPGH